MKEWPLTNNVYGILEANTSLENVAEVFRSRLGLTQANAYVYKSQSDDNETLRIRAEDYDFETYRNIENILFFNGAVAGNPGEVLATVKQISDVLRWAGYETKFEIYDNEFEFRAEYP